MANFPDIPVPRKRDPDGNYDTLAAIRAVLTEHALAGAGSSVSQRLTDIEDTPPIHDHSDDTEGGNTLVVPTIADLTNAQHDHLNAAGGGAAVIDPIVLADAAKTFVHGDMNKVYVVTPTTTRIFTLPSTSVLAGDMIEVHNLASAQDITIEASGGEDISTFRNHSIRLIALQAAPTTAPHWRIHSHVPTGEVAFFAASSAPPGWLLCDGASYTEIAQQALFGVIGTTYGGGAGSFNVPDTRGRALITLDNLGGTSANRITNAQADSLGGNAGSENHTHTSAAHSHTLDNSGGARVQTDAGALALGCDTGAGPNFTETHSVGLVNTINNNGPSAGLLGSTNSVTPGATGSQDGTQPWMALTCMIKA